MAFLRKSALIDQEKLEEAFKLLDSGRESFRSLEAKLGIPKSTLCLWYAQRLEEKVEERKKIAEELEQKILKLHTELSGLESKYKERGKLLAEEYQKKKADLEGEIERLRKEADTIKASFEAQGLSFEEGVKILKQIQDLREEKESLAKEVAQLKSEHSYWQKRISIMRSDYSILEKDLAEKYEELDRLSYLIASARRSLYATKEEVRKLTPLRLEVERLKNQIKDLESEIAAKKTELEGLEESKRILTTFIESEMVKAKEEADRIIENARRFADEIVSEAERREKELYELEQLRKEKEKLEAEKALLEKAIKMMLKELRARLEKEATYTSSEKPSSPLDLLLARILSLSPLPKSL